MKLYRYAITVLFLSMGMSAFAEPFGGGGGGFGFRPPRLPFPGGRPPVRPPHPGGGISHNTRAMQESARKLEFELKQFERIVCRFYGNSGFAREVDQLSDAVEHFNRALQMGETYAHLRRDFDRIAQSYRRIEYVVERQYRRDLRLNRNWDDVEYYYQDLAWAMGCD